MTYFEEPAIEVVRFDTPDILTKSYFTFGSTDNSYINEDNYHMETNPWL